MFIRDGGADSVVWSSSNTAIAQVDSATGKVTAIAPGTAVITAKAGSKSATCNVKVTCAHSLTTIPAKESDCSNNGWHAYQKCTICNELFDTSGIPITGVPYADLNNNHDFDTSEWGYKAADGNIEYYTCECGKIYEDAAATRVIENISGTILEKKGHDYSVKNSDAEHRRSTAADCREYDTYWFTCANDATHNAKNDESAANKYYNGAQGAHVFGTEFVDCGEAVHAHNCQYHNNAHDAVQAHRPDREAPTENVPVKCLDCARILTPALGHDLVKIEGTKPSYTSSGIKDSYKCNGCDRIFEDPEATVEVTSETQLILAALNHNFVWKTDKEATQAETGLKHEECTECGLKRNENTVIDKLPANAEPEKRTEKKAESKTEAKKESSKSPNTGTSDMALWTALLFVSGGAAACLTFAKKKRKLDEE